MTNKNTILAGVLGLATGYALRPATTSTQTTTLECLSTPLLNPETVVLITETDYKEILSFDTGTQRHDLWSAYIIELGTRKLMFGFEYFFEDPNNLTVRFKDLANPSTSSITLSATLTYESNGIMITTPYGSCLYKYNMSSIIDFTIPGYGQIYFEINNGYPFKFNDGEITNFVNNGHWKGFEIVGDVIGNINGINISGTGIFEKLNWNFYEYQTFGYEYIALNTPQIKGILVKAFQYLDAGLWINGLYYKPLYFEINTINSNRDQTLTIIISDDIKYVINLNRINSLSEQRHIYATSTLPINQDLAGYAWIDTGINIF